MSNKKQPQKKMSEGTQALIVCLVAVAIMIIAIVIVMVATINDGSEANTVKPSTQTSAVTEAGTATPGADVDMTEVKAEIDSMTSGDFEEVDETTEYVKLTIKGMGDIIVRLRSDVAPLTVKNFQKLVKEGFYDGTIFHRVMQNFMIQGGSGETVGKTASNVKGEFAANGIGNNLGHIRGVISMARVGGQNNSATSQFFICNATNGSVTGLDGQYATFGYVVAGMDVVDAISAVECDNSNPQSPRPYEDVVIESACFVSPLTSSTETTVETTVDTTVETTVETTVDTTVETTADTQA